MLVVVAFFMGVHWQKRVPARMVPTASAAATSDLPKIKGPGKILTEPDVVGMVADFEPIEALMVGASKLITFHKAVFVNLARELAGEGIPMVAFVSDAQQKVWCENAVQEAGLAPDAVQVVVHPLNTMWLRDYGPIFVRREDRSIGIVDASYSTTNDNEENRWRDDEFPIMLSESLKIPLTTAPVRVSGGNMLSNGEGFLLTSTEVIKANRTRGYTVRKLAVHLQHFMAVRQWVYVQPPAREDTGHVDMFVTLLKPNVAVVAQAGPETDPMNASIMDEAARFLSAIHTSVGPMKVYRIPLPSHEDGLFRSYTNVIQANNLVLVPVFAGVDPIQQEQALDMFRKLLPEKKVVGINVDELLDEYGFLRCMSMGIPKGIGWKRMLSWNMDADDGS
jgi:agmatine deiminase